jgi:hypothetical protein
VLATLSDDATIAPPSAVTRSAISIQRRKRAVPTSRVPSARRPASIPAMNTAAMAVAVSRDTPVLAATIEEPHTTYENSIDTASTTKAHTAQKARGRRSSLVAVPRAGAGPGSGPGDSPPASSSAP